MPSPVLNEGWYDGGFLISHANGHLSFTPGFIDNATAGDIQYSAGLVVAQNLTGAAAATANAGNTGNGTISAVTVLNGALFGAYSVSFTAPTAFELFDPAGNLVGTGATGAQFSNELQFTITAGSAAFAAGDGFSINVTEASGAWQSWTGGAIPVNAANQPLIGLLYNRLWVRAGEAEEAAIVTREAEVQQAALQWDPAVTSAGNAAALQATALAALAQLNIIAR